MENTLAIEPKVKTIDRRKTGKSSAIDVFLQNKLDVLSEKISVNQRESLNLYFYFPQIARIFADFLMKFRLHKYLE